MRGNKYVTASCNIITGSADYGVADQSAVRVLTGDDYTIGCNDVYSTENGIYIQSAMSVADIKGNNFHDLNHAFHYTQNGKSDQQDFQGNIWHNQVPMNGGKGTYVFDTSHLFPGVYYYEVSSKGIPVHNGKLVIIR